MSHSPRKKRTELSQSAEEFCPCTRSPLHQSDSFNRGRKRKRGDGDQLDEITENPVNERPLGLCSPTEKSSPYIITQLKDAIFGKFENVRIYVNSDKVVPNRVWYMPSDGTEETYPASGRHYEVVHDLGDLEPSLGQYLGKWRKKRKGEGMLKMFSFFEEVEKFLKWNASVKSWYEVPCAEMTPSDDSDSDCSGSSPLPRMLENIFNVLYFVLALKQKMVNSEGRRAVYMLVQCACAIAFGRKFTKKNKVGIYCVGSSNAHCEAFPVQVTQSARRSSDTSCDLRSATDSNISNATDSNISNATDSNISNAGGTGSVLADIVVASGHKPNWPRFLLVGEIKSEALTEKCLSQLMREMAAPLMHQSEVFGLLINDQEADIVQLQHKFKEKSITMKTSTYSLIQRSTVPTFSVSEMKRFFVHLVAALDYSKNEIKEIYHGY